MQALIPQPILAWYGRSKYDVYLVSFPKCGRTWLRTLIGKCIQLEFGLPEGGEILELDQLARHNPAIPRICVTHDEFAHLKAATDLAVDKSEFAGHRVILLVRDPRDVIVSLFHHMSNRENRYAGSIGMSEFIRHSVGGFDSLLRFYDVWADALSIPSDVLLVRYEDMQSSPECELERVMSFLPLPIGGGVIRDAIQFGSFENMRRLEESDQLGSWRLRAGEVGNVNTYKTRRGKVGGYIDELSQTDLDYTSAAMAASRVSVFGYTA